MDKNSKDLETKVIEVIDKLRPFLISDGGNIEFVKLEDNIVYVKMMGHCAGCPMLDTTLKEGIEIAITSEIPEIIEVRNVEE